MNFRAPFQAQPVFCDYKTLWGPSRTWIKHCLREVLIVVEEDCVIQDAPPRSLPSEVGSSYAYKESYSKCSSSLNYTPVVFAVSPVSIHLVTWSGPRWKVILGGHVSFTTIRLKEQSSEEKGNPLVSTYSFLMTALPGAGSVLNI